MADVTTTNPITQDTMYDDLTWTTGLGTPTDAVSVYFDHEAKPTDIIASLKRARQMIIQYLSTLGV